MSTLYGNELTNSQILGTPGFRWKNFCLDADLLWAKPKHAHKLTIKWKDVPFRKSERKGIPTGQGIYMFCLDVRKKLDMNGTSNYVLYIGQADNLQKRFNDYFGYASSTEPSDFLKRCMTVVWEGKLRFHYFLTGPLSLKELTLVEFDFIDSVIPPINQRFRGRVVKKAIKLYSPR